MAYLLPISIAVVVSPLLYAWYHIFVVPRSNPLRQLYGPPVTTLFGSHLGPVLE